MPIEGLDSFKKNMQKEADRIKAEAKVLDGEVNLVDLFNPNFMQRYTIYATVEDFFSACGFEPEADLEETEFDTVMNTQVPKLTKFQSWDDMIGRALQEHIESKLVL